MGTSRSKPSDGNELEPPRRATPTAAAATYLPWRPVTPHDGESVRWECIDGRWITIGLGSGKRAGLAVVQHSGVLCEYVDNYEAALALAKKWRTI